MPSKICQDCHLFLNEIERRKRLYAKVEQMYLELIRMPSRTTNREFADIKTRHNIDELLLGNEILQDDKIMEVQVEYVTESNYLEKGNWNIEVIDQPVEPASSAKPKVASNLKKSTRSSTMTMEKLQNVPEKTESSEKKSFPCNNVFQCDHCARNFKTKLLIVKHISNYHSKKDLISDTLDGEKMFDCQTCSKSFKTVS